MEKISSSYLFWKLYDLHQGSKSIEMEFQNLKSLNVETPTISRNNTIAHKSSYTNFTVWYHSVNVGMGKTQTM